MNGEQLTLDKSLSEVERKDRLDKIEYLSKALEFLNQRGVKTKNIPDYLSEALQYDVKKKNERTLLKNNLQIYYNTQIISYRYNLYVDNIKKIYEANHYRELAYNLRIDILNNSLKDEIIKSMSPEFCFIG